VRGSCISFARLSLFWLIFCSIPATASAEIGATASIFSDERFRGFSLSEGRPVAIADVDYDDPSGFYVDGSGSVVFRSGLSPAPLGVQLIGGYAKRLRSGTTIDFGLTHSSYSRCSSGCEGQSYSEIYAGIVHGILSSRIFLSPHYFASGRWIAYGELNASFSPAPKWSIDAHLGMLTVLRTQSRQSYRSNLDWRLGLSRGFGRVSLHAAWVGHGRAPQPFASTLRQSPRKKALVVGLTTAL
jgi:uncharacterized protein (TIGR02001 family)